jgi:hypothetical protein
MNSKVTPGSVVAAEEGVGWVNGVGIVRKPADGERRGGWMVFFAPPLPTRSEEVVCVEEKSTSTVHRAEMTSSSAGNSQPSLSTRRR